jgi:hypothetical protein
VTETPARYRKKPVTIDAIQFTNTESAPSSATQSASTSVVY